MTMIDEIVENFALLEEWDDRYRYVIELGRGLSPLPGSAHNEANKVRGCASQVWLVSSRGAGGTLIFHGDSDAHIVRGLIAIVISLYSGRTPDEILGFDFRSAFDRLGLKGALSTQRSNGLFSMIERIRRDAAGAKAEAQAS